MTKRVAVCCIVKNEESLIKEWILYHISLGFNTVFIYDNGSTDNTCKVVMNLRKLFDIRYIEWKRNDFYYQIDCYKDCINNNKEEFRWIAFFDSDEFIVPYGMNNINDFLKSYEYASCVVVNWAIFGSSGLIDTPKNLITENFIWRSDCLFYNNRHIKSIINPRDYLNCINAHYFEVSGITVDVLHSQPKWEKKGIISEDPVYKKCQINHYYTRSKQCYYKKIKRGYHDIDTSSIKESDLLIGFDRFDRNEVYDVNIFYNMEKLKNIYDYVSKFY